MDEWVELGMPWWQLVARASVSYLGLLLLMRLAGKHAFGEMSPFEILILMIAGSTLRTAILGNDRSLLGPFIAIASIVILDKMIAHACARWSAAETFFSGRSVLLAKRGVVDSEALRDHAIAQAEFDRAMREKGIRTPTTVDEARLEANGKITFLTTPGKS